MIEPYLLVTLFQNLVDLSERQLFIHVIIVLWSTVVTLIIFIAFLFRQATREQKDTIKVMTEISLRSNLVIENNTRTHDSLIKHFKNHIET